MYFLNNFGFFRLIFKNITPLHISCQLGNADIVKILLKSKWIDIKAKTFYEKTARELSTKKEIQMLLDEMLCL